MKLIDALHVNDLNSSFRILQKNEKEHLISETFSSRYDWFVWYLNASINQNSRLSME